MILLILKRLALGVLPLSSPSEKALLVLAGSEGDRRRRREW